MSVQQINLRAFALIILTYIIRLDMVFKARPISNYSNTNMLNPWTCSMPMPSNCTCASKLNKIMFSVVTTRMVNFYEKSTTIVTTTNSFYGPFPRQPG